MALKWLFEDFVSETCHCPCLLLTPLADAPVYICPNASTSAQYLSYPPPSCAFRILSKSSSVSRPKTKYATLANIKQS